MAKLLNSLLVFLALLITVVWSIVIATTVILIRHIHYGLAFETVRVWASGVCVLFGIRREVIGLENLRGAKAFVVAPNHESNLDIFVVTSLPVHAVYVSKKVVSYVPFVGWAMAVMGTYWVRRDRSAHDLNVMKTVEDGLKNGKSVIIFPEGTRSRTGELGPFKKGAFRTAINAGVPLCPVAITGTYKIAPAGQLPRRLGHHVTVRIGKPFYPDPNSTLDKAIQEFRTVITGLLEANKNNNMV